MRTLARSYAGVMTADYAAARSESCALRFRYRTRGEVVVRAVRRFLPDAPVTVLDVGAAEGRTLAYVASRLRAGRFVGLEYCRALREANRDLPANIELVAGDAMNLCASFAEASFNVVSMLALIEHVDNPEIAVEQAVRVCRPGGIVVATSPSPAWDRLAGRLGLVKGEHHVEGIDLAQLGRMFGAAGLQVVDGGRFMWSPIASAPYLKIPVPPRFALAVDRVVGRVPLLGRGCVNSFVVGRKESVEKGGA